MKSAGYFLKLGSKYIVLGLNDQYLFAVIYIAAVITKHIVCLLPENHLIPDNMQPAYIVDDKRLKEIMNNVPISENELINTEDLPLLEGRTSYSHSSVLASFWYSGRFNWPSSSGMLSVCA